MSDEYHPPPFPTTQNPLAASSPSSSKLSLRSAATVSGKLAVHSRNRVKSKAKRVRKHLLEVTHHSFVAGFFGQLQGGERLAFASFSLLLVSLCFAHLAVGLAGLKDKDNVMYRTSVETADSSFWTTGPLAGSDFYFAASACAPAGTTITNIACRSTDNENYENQDFPTVCEDITTPQGSIFAPLGGAEKFPFTCCACFYPKKVFDGNVNIAMIFEGGEGSGSAGFIAGKTTLLNLKGVDTTKENWHHEVYDEYLRENIYDLDETWVALMSPLNTCKDGETNATVPELFFREVSAYHPNSPLPPHR